MPTAYIALGSNMASAAGSPEATLEAASRQLQSVGILRAKSSLYSTEPVGFTEQPRFLNAAVAVDTNLSPHALLEALLSIERTFGRDRASGIPNGPRTLDLDILLMGDICLGEYGLEIPHPRLAERAFVLIPLHEIAPKLIVPGYAKTVSQLLEELPSPSEGKADAVVLVQSEIWRAGPGVGSAGDAAPSGPGAPGDHRNG